MPDHKAFCGADPTRIVYVQQRDYYLWALAEADIINDIVRIISLA